MVILVTAAAPRQKSRKNDRSIFSRPAPNADADTDELANSFSQLSVHHETLSFEDMKLRPELLRGILEYGLEKPAGIQKRAIVPCAAGHDIIMQAQSGMGKTAAAVIGILQRLDLTDRCQVLVLAPTRELAIQITTVFSKLGHYMRGFKVYACVGGKSGSRKKNKAVLTAPKAPHVIVGSLGRIVDLIEIGELRADSIKMFLMDEADQMLGNRTFRKHLKQVFEKLSGNAQMIFMSATMPPFQLKQAKLLARNNPAIFTLENNELTLDGIRQFHIKVDNEDQKLSVMIDLQPLLADQQGLIFCNTKHRVKSLRQKLQKYYKNTGVMQGDLEQSQREEVVKSFRNLSVKNLITSDVLGRGVDFQHVSLVVNYDIPYYMDEYIHRIGRAGRFGRKGVAVTIITERQTDYLNKISEYFHTEIPPMPTNIGGILQAVA